MFYFSCSLSLFTFTCLFNLLGGEREREREREGGVLICSTLLARYLYLYLYLYTNFQAQDFATRSSIDF
jgi:hypothetical protein